MSAITLRSVKGSELTANEIDANFINLNTDKAEKASPTLSDPTYTGTLTGSTGILNIGSGQVYKDASGNVGIGLTPTAGVKLHVGGTVFSQSPNTAGGGTVGAIASDYFSTPTYASTNIIQYDSATAGTTCGLSNVRLGQLYFTNSSAGLIWANSPIPLVFANSGTERMRIDSSGNVGIGTSSPARKLDILDTALVSLKIQSSFLSGNKTYSGLQIGASATNQACTIGYSYDSVTPANSFAHITTYGGTEGNQFAMAPSGNVGIGTSSPSSKLTISGSDQLSLFTSVNGNSYLRTTATTNDAAFGVDGNGGFFAVVNSAPLLLKTNNAERMRIDGSGNVGIGTSSPSSYGKLAIVTTDSVPAVDVRADGRTYLTSSSYANYVLHNRSAIYAARGTNAVPLALGGGDYIYDQIFYGYDGTSFLGTASISALTSTISAGSVPTSLVFGTGTSTQTERMRIDSSGNVGIGAIANASAILDAQSTTKGVRFPNMTTTQKNAISSPAAGLVVFDTTLAKLCVYSGAAWQTITSV